MDSKKISLNLDVALEEIARKIRPTAAVRTISPSHCLTENCSPQCDCCSDCGMYCGDTGYAATESVSDC